VTLFDDSFDPKNKPMDLKKLRETRIPSKMKRWLRRKYAKKHTR